MLSPTALTHTHTHTRHEIPPSATIVQTQFNDTND